MRYLTAVTTCVLLCIPPAMSFAEVDFWDVALVEDVDGSLGDMQTLAMPNVYLQKVACAFYDKHPDNFDAIFVFTTYPLNFITNVQQGWPVQNFSQGIGRPLTNQSAQFCSYDTRLRQAVKMGDINILPNDPDDQYTGIPWYALSGIELMAHEFGHQWLAAVTFMKEDGVKHCFLRGYEPTGEGEPGECDGLQESDYNQHWSYYFDSRSVMYGSFIEDLGNGQFELSYNDPKYSPLDQYLMGLRLPEDVGPLFLVDVGDDAVVSSASLPIQPGKTDTIEGTRVDFTAQDVIRAEGPRDPPLEPCHWKGALIIVHPYGEPASDAARNRVVAYGNRFEEFYAWATDGRGSFDLTLDGSGTGTEGCPGSSSPVPDQNFPERPDMAQPEPMPDVIAPEEDQGPVGETPAVTGDDGVGDGGMTDGGGNEAGPLCTPDTLLCHPYENLVVRCNATGDGWTTEEDCGGDALCDGGMCRLLHGGGGDCSASIGARPTAGPWLLLMLFLILAVISSRVRARY